MGSQWKHHLSTGWMRCRHYLSLEILDECEEEDDDDELIQDMG